MRLKQYINEANKSLKDWKGYVNRIPMLKNAVRVLEKITSKGYSAYIVGGTVRDLILGIAPHDVDISTNCPIDVLSTMYKTYDIGQSKNFGIVTIKEGGFPYEVAQYRSDGKYLDGRRPEKIEIKGSFETDSARRDFTINSMGIDKDGNIIDKFGGKNDIKNKTLKTVGDPYKRFSEDYLRIMRLGRFSSKLGFDIEKGTKKAAKKLSKNVLNLSPERIRDEIIKAASQSGDKFAEYIITLDKLGILKHILPEVLQLKYMQHNLTHHPEGNAFQHTIAALRSSNVADPIKNLSILLHDIGKGTTLSHVDGLPKYLGHAKAGISLANEIADRLKLSNKERDAIIFSIANHMKFHDILKMKASKVVKLINDDNWDTLLAVAKADVWSRGYDNKYAKQFYETVEKAIEIKNKYGLEGVSKRMKLVDGNHVISITGLKQGKKVGDIIRNTTEWILDQNVEDKKLIDKYIMSQV